MAKWCVNRCSALLIIKRNANQNYNEVHLIAPHSSQNGHHQKKSTNNKCQRGCGIKEPSYTVDGNVTWYSHCGEKYRGVFKK